MLKITELCMLMLLALPCFAQLASDDPVVVESYESTQAMNGLVRSNRERLICCETFERGSNAGNIVLLKFDGEDNIVFDQIISMPGAQYCAEIVEDAQGYLLVGWTSEGVNDSRDGLVIRIDFDGYVTWHKTFGGAARDDFRSVCRAADGGWICCGQTFSQGDGEGDLWLVKLDSLGNQVWELVYGSVLPDWGSAIRPIHGNGYMVAGSQGTTNKNMQMLALSVSDAGDVNWSRQLGVADYECGEAVVVDGTEAAYFIGSGSTIYQSLMDVFVVKISIEGNVAWQRRYGNGSFYDYGVSGCINEAGRLMVLGNSKSNSDNQHDALLIELDEDGTVIEKLTNNDFRDTWHHHLMLYDGGYTVLGQQHRAAGGWNTIMQSWYPLSSAVKMEDVDEVSLISTNVPNPFKSYTMISVPWKNESNVELTVFNILGQPVESQIVDRTSESGQDIHYNSAQLVSGIYLYQLREISTGEICSGRMTVLK
ncbi:T9SS type A sorting domain-containing protein [bacterium]|nr:T9SS type A sorting domain-containing protein [bacterium]